MRKKAIIIAIILLACQFFLQVYMAKTDAQTTDEGVHLSAGYTYIVKHDFRFNPEHPPLVKILAAAPLLFIHPKLPTDNYYWDRGSNFFYDTWREAVAFGERFLYNSDNPEYLLFFGRLPIIAVTLILGISIFFIASKLWGYLGGLVALTFYVLDPNINAHGHLITTDVAVSLGYLWAVYLFWVFLNKTNWRNLFLFSLAFSFAQIVKFTAVILYPTLIILLIFFAVSNKWQIKKIGRVLPMLLVVLLINWAVIWTFYGFKTTLAPEANSIISEIKASNYESQPGVVEELKDLPPQSSDKISPSTTADKIYAKIRYILVPRDYFKGLIMLLTHVGGGHNSFLLGMSSGTGWWYYFPVLFLLKTPIPALLALGFALYLIFKTRKNYKESTYLGLAALFFLIFAMFSKANLGIRHIFPIYPIIYIVSGGLILTNLSKKIALILAGWLLLESVIIFPYFLSYFNEFAGGTYNGYKIASDSNIDWGQDLKRIKKYMDQKNIRSAYVEYNWDGKYSLDYYGINRLPLDQLGPQSKGYVILGSSALDGPNYSWLRDKKPYDRITPSVFVYKLD